MIVLSNTTAQELAPGQAITFNTVVLHTGNGECHRPGTSSVKMKSNGIYEASFRANIGATAPGVAQVAVTVGGEPLLETTAKSTTVAAGDLNNVATKTIIRNCCCDYDRLSVVNTGTTTITIDANPLFFIKRVS